MYLISELIPLNRPEPTPPIVQSRAEVYRTPRQPVAVDGVWGPRTMRAFRNPSPSSYVERPRASYAPRSTSSDSSFNVPLALAFSAFF